jgi:hypothetical protein
MDIVFEKINADRLLENCFLFDDPWAMEATNVPYTFEGEIDWKINPFNDPEWTFMLARHDFVLKLAQVGDYLNDSKYLNKSKELLFDFIYRVPFSKDLTSTSWRSIDGAIRIKNWINSYEILNKHNILNKEEKDNFFKSAVAHSTYLCEIDTPFTRQSNWGIIGDSGLFCAASFLGNRFLINISQKRLIVQLRNQILEDGFQWEQSPMYHVEVLLSIFDVIETASKYNIELDTMIEKTAIEMTYAIIKSQKPNHHQLLQGDSDDTDVGDILAKAALLFNNGVFKYFAPQTITYPYGDKQIKEYESIEIKMPDFQSIAMEESGNYYFRSGWSESDSYLHFFCGNLGGGHAHSNLLHFDFTYGKEDIIVDSGRYNYTDCNERYLLKSTKYHNSMVMDERDYCPVKDSWTYLFKPSFIKGRFIEKGNYKFVNGFNSSYLNIDGSLMERKIIQLNKELVLVFDNIICNGKHKINRYFHFDNQGVLEKEDNCIYYNKKNLKAFMYFENSSSIKIEETLYSKHYNELETKPSLNVENNIDNNTSFLSAINIGKSKLIIKELSIESMRFNTIFTKDEVRAFSIKQEDREAYIVLFALKQCLDGVDMFKAGNLCGYGKTLIYNNKKLEKIEI